MSADGSGGFDKSQLKKVEAAGGLNPPKGYIPVVAIGDEVIRESSVLVERVAQLSEETAGAKSLVPERPEHAEELVRMCNALPKSERSRQLDEMVRCVDERCASSTLAPSAATAVLRTFAEAA